MDYCISDIHGYYGLFCRLLDKIRFSDKDKLYVMGDIVDKGLDSIRLAKLLFSMPNVYCIAGNHEYDFLKYYRALMRQTEDYDWVLEKLRSYFTDGYLLDWKTVDRFDLLPFYIETDKFIGVHAGIPFQDGMLLPPEDARPEQLVYDRFFKEPNVLPRGEKCILYGHTPVRYLTGRDEILLYQRDGTGKGSQNIADYCKIHLATGVALSGVLGCFTVNSCQTFYVND